MWQDYEMTYQDARQDSEFLSWRELGARGKAENGLLASWWSRCLRREHSAISFGGSFSVGPYPSIAGAGHMQFWSPSSIARFLTQDAGLEILNRHQDLLGDEADSGAKNGPGARTLVKRILGTGLPGFVYSRLLTTHAAFLCQRPDHHS
jgi:hypothetical protein